MWHHNGSDYNRRKEISSPGLRASVVRTLARMHQRVMSSILGQGPVPGLQVGSSAPVPACVEWEGQLINVSLTWLSFFLSAPLSLSL